MRIQTNSLLLAIVTAIALIALAAPSSIATVAPRKDSSWKHLFDDGIASLKQHRYKESEAYFLQSLNSVDHHVNRTLTSLMALEELYEITNDYQAKELVLLSHLQILKMYCRPCSLEADVYLQLGDLYSMTQRYESGKHQYLQALSIIEGFAVKDDLSRGATLNNLAYCELQLKDFTTAELHYKQALTAFTKALGPNSICFGLTAGNLADLYGYTKHDKLALTYFEKAIFALSSHVGTHDPVVQELIERASIVKRRLINPQFRKQQNYPQPRQQFQLPKQPRDFAIIFIDEASPINLAGAKI